MVLGIIDMHSCQETASDTAIDKLIGLWCAGSGNTSAVGRDLGRPSGFELSEREEDNNDEVGRVTVGKNERMESKLGNRQGIQDGQRKPLKDSLLK